MAWFRSGPSGTVIPQTNRIQQAEVTVMERPAPIAYEPEPKQDMSEYIAVADALGFEPEPLRMHRRTEKRSALIEFILDQGLPIYGNEQVHDYMTALAKKAYDAKNDTQKKYVTETLFCWKRLDQPKEPAPMVSVVPTQVFQATQWESSLLLTQRLAGMPFGNWTAYKHGDTLDTRYPHAVPVEMLKRAAVIKKQYGDKARIYVSDYEDVRPDPFIMVKLDDCEHVIFGAWDEPGFGMKK